ncbi:MAG TPA: hypothetical protein VN713_06040 [Sphingomicrobium sp.]|nr:hypothetical protein [Sphingomicrobium sp.]
MEVHKPKLVANWRELFKEWGIIVLGVLTALLAEQAVQSIAWRHKVDAAIADMDNELGSGDGPQAYARLAMHDCLARRLNLIRSAVERGDRPQSAALIDRIWLPERTYDSLAREAATASDVASHMPHERMLQYRIIYEVIPDMDRLSDRELVDLSRLRALSHSGGTLQTPERLAAVTAIEALRVDNDAISREARFALQHMRLNRLKLDTAFVRENVEEARPHYPTCLAHAPDVGPIPT